MSVVLKAEKRENLGSSATRKLRREGRIPAVIYSPAGNVNLSVDNKEFEHEYFKGTILTSVVELDLDGKKVKVIAHKVELDPVSDRPAHIDFLNCAENAVVRATPKLVFINQDRSPGLKKGGFLHIVLRKTAVICENAAAIPNKIEIDAATMQVGHKVRAHALKLPAGVTLVDKKNFLIASITGRGKADEEATPTGAAPAAGAAPAKADAKAAEKKTDKK